ncbi:MAG: hypothetical protein AAFR16_06305 [Pseudomonadota bacterium]
MTERGAMDWDSILNWRLLRGSHELGRQAKPIAVDLVREWMAAARLEAALAIVDAMDPDALTPEEKRIQQRDALFKEWVEAGRPGGGFIEWAHGREAAAQ